MMRLRRASVIVMLSLLTWTATASAECAWVLWERSGQYTAGTSDTPKLSTEAVRAYTTRAECQRTIAIQLAKFKTSPAGSVQVLDDLQEAYVTTQNGGKFVTTSYGYTCLPDTVDPRGPKGK